MFGDEGPKSARDDSANSRAKRQIMVRSSMADIISYKDSLQYRDVPLEGKVTNATNKTILERTKQTLQDIKNGPRMTKDKEMQSNIF